MKILTAVCVMALLVIASAAWAGAPKRVKFTWSGGEAVAELNGSQSAESLWAMLPVTVDFKDFNGVERIAYTEKELSTEGAPESCTPDAGTLALYAPWGNLSVFYKPFRESRGLVPLGRFVEGADKVSTLGEAVRIERME
ncbi:MAG TPA: hypothetical protein IAC22_02335 [Candidatus Caccocola faecipullorum]|nr:hypothetical protein [Candidatus Caccocola faecipullorum]